MQPDFHDLDSWFGLLNTAERPKGSIILRAPIRRAKSSGAGAFLGLAEDGREYWIKVPNNPQGSQVLVNEVIVAEVGKLLQAPVRDRELIVIPPLITQWSEFPIGKSDVPLLAHGSLNVPHAEDSDSLIYTKNDGNPQRQAALIALWDLCLGEDPQWLYEISAAYSLWSYDHGFWFTTGEGDWSIDILKKMKDSNFSYVAPPKDIDLDHFFVIADRIEALNPDSLISAMSKVPVEWNTSNKELEAMAWFIFYRKKSVANRLRQAAGTQR